MAFIFMAEHDSGREGHGSMSDFKAGDKVTYRNMVMPAEVLSGPHQTTGARQRYLIRKADGNVSLVRTQEIRRVVPRMDKVAGTLAVILYGRSYVSLGLSERIKVAQAAARALAIADDTHGEV